MVALPAVLVSPNLVTPLKLLVMVALPAVLVSTKSVRPPKLVVMVALPAVLVPMNCKTPLPAIEKIGTLEELLTTPMPVKVRRPGPVTLKEYAGAPALNNISPTEGLFKGRENVIDVMLEGPNVAVPVGTICGVQLVLVFQSLDPGFVSQVSWA